MKADVLFTRSQLEKTEHANSLTLLRLFSTGTWKDYAGQHCKEDGDDWRNLLVRVRRLDLNRCSVHGQISLCFAHCRKQWQLPAAVTSPAAEAQAADGRVHCREHEGDLETISSPYIPRCTLHLSHCTLSMLSSLTTALAILNIYLVPQNVPYDHLMQQLGVSNVRELEDLLISDCFYPKLISGKLDQKVLMTAQQISMNVQQGFPRRGAPWHCCTVGLLGSMHIFYAHKNALFLCCKAIRWHMSPCVDESPVNCRHAPLWWRTLLGVMCSRSAYQRSLPAWSSGVLRLSASAHALSDASASSQCPRQLDSPLLLKYTMTKAHLTSAHASFDVLPMHE